jgi:Xaa-Pro dipeptidase
MTTVPVDTTPHLDPGPSLSDGEFQRRWAAVQAHLGPLGLDAIAVTYQLHAEYLTATWGSQFWVSPVIVPASAEPLYLVRRFDEDRVRIESKVPRIRSYFDRDDAIEAWAAALRELGLERSRLGLELDNLDLTHRDVTELQRLLPDLEIVDASAVLPRLMAVKSDEEIAVMRIAAARTRIAVEAFRAGLCEGVSERELREQMFRAVTAAGSDDLRGGVAFGASASVPHGGNGPTRLALNEGAFTECSGYHLGYCATICRTAVFGRSRVVESLYSVARAAVDAIEATLRPGITAGDVDKACRTVVEQAGLGAAFRHRTGYAVGLRANGRLNLSLKPGADDVIEAGMTFHTPIILFEPGVAGVGCSETFLVTPTGAEPLAGLSRDLIVR